MIAWGLICTILTGLLQLAAVCSHRQTRAARAVGAECFSNADHRRQTGLLQLTAVWSDRQTHVASTVGAECLSKADHRSQTGLLQLYSNSMLYGVTDKLIQQVQSVQNASARLITGAKLDYCNCTATRCCTE